MKFKLLLFTLLLVGVSTICYAFGDTVYKEFRDDGNILTTMDIGRSLSIGNSLTANSIFLADGTQITSGSMSQWTDQTTYIEPMNARDVHVNQDLSVKGDLTVHGLLFITDPNYIPYDLGIELSVNGVNSADLTANNLRIQGCCISNFTDSFSFSDLDIGAEAANTWYAVIVELDYHTGAAKVILSTSATSSNLTTGYELQRRVAWIRNDASSNMVSIRQLDNEVSYAVRQLVNGAGTATSYTDVDLSAYIPPTAYYISGYADIFDVNSSTVQGQIRPNGISGEYLWINFGAAGATNVAGRIPFSCPTDSRQVIEYKMSADDDYNQIYLTNYTDKF